MELRTCPICGYDQPEQVVRLTPENRQRFVAFSDRKFAGLLTKWIEELDPTILRCSHCTHHWYKRQPSADQLGQMYASGRRLLEMGSPRSLRNPTAKMIAEMQSLRKILPPGTAPRLLDYGSGYGRWARAAVKAGFATTAFEPSMSRGAETAIPFVLVHDLAELKAYTFDVIHLEQVLEHLPSPLQTLKSLHGLCHPETILRITVPNLLRCPEGRELWEQWPYNGRTVHSMAPFEHVHGFTPRSLSRLLERAGYRPLPLYQIIRYHPQAAIRRVLGRLLSRLGTTLALVKPV